MTYILLALKTLALGFAMGVGILLLGVLIAVVIDYRPKSGLGGRGP